MTVRKIVLANQKGGVAKTTTAVNLAFGLAMQGKRVLLIDMDPQSNASFATIGVEERKLSTYDLLINDASVTDVVVETKQPGLHLIPSHINLAGAEVELANAVGGQHILRTKLAEHFEAYGDESYQYVIIDAPPSLGFLTINSLAAAEEIIIPVSASVFALNGIAMLERTINQVRRRLNNPNLRVSGVLCTMYEDTNIAKDVLKQLRQHFGDSVFNAVIRKNVKVEEAHSRAESVFTYAPNSTGATSYTELVQEVISRE